MKEKKLKVREKGITLIALVITIIVLLILAGVTIATLTGDNGILTQANSAKERTEQAEDIERIKLAISEAQIGENGYRALDSNNLQRAINGQFIGRNVVVSDNGNGTFTVSCLDTLKDYIISGNKVEEGVDWNETMANAVAPESQDEERNEGVIGIGTDGKTVDMDLWEYEYDDATEGFGLNDSTSLTTSASADASKGYLGTDFDNIIIPQYISTDEGENWIAVTNLDWVFYNCSELIKVNKLPSTIKSLKFTFRNCIQLSSAPELPNSIEILNGTFYDCKNLKTFDKNIPLNTRDMASTFTGCNNLSKFEAIIPDNVINMYMTFSSTGLVEFAIPIPDSVVNMNATFRNCTLLSKFNTTISNNVTNMQETFYNCKMLENINIRIPDSVINFYNTFRECSKLSGVIEINANLNGNIMENGRRDYEYCFLYSSIESKGLEIKCSEKIYNLFYDESTSNKLNNKVCEENSNIKMYKIIY